MTDPSDLDLWRRTADWALAEDLTSATLDALSWPALGASLPYFFAPSTDRSWPGIGGSGRSDWEIGQPTSSCSDMNATTQSNERSAKSR